MSDSKTAMPSYCHVVEGHFDLNRCSIDLKVNRDYLHFMVNICDKFENLRQTCVYLSSGQDGNGVVPYCHIIVS